MKYLAVLGRQPELSVAELEAQFLMNTASFASQYVLFETDSSVQIDRFGGVKKFAVLLNETPLEYLRNVSDGKITIGVSDYSKKASRKTATMEGLKLKKIMARHGRSVRVVENKEAVLSTATSLHNGLSGKNERKVELIKTDDEWYKVIGVQNIDAYARRDQARPARDAKVGMLPPKLAQVLINLCGPLELGATILDPFCGTGVVLQEALLMGYRAYGTDVSERMVDYSDKNLKHFKFSNYKVEVGDATTFCWEQPISAVACEGYLGRPMSMVPAEIKLREEKQKCSVIILGFLKNLVKQIAVDTPVVMAVPAWLRPDGIYSRLDILDEIEGMGYNVSSKTREGLLYHRKEQVVARDIIILRKN